MRSACANQGSSFALCLPGLGFARLALGVAKAARKQAFHCLAQRSRSLQDTVALTIRSSARRHARYMVEQPHDQMQHHERHQQRSQHEVERHLHPIRRVEQYDVAQIELGKQRQPNGGGKQQRNPEYPAHAHSLP